MIIIYVQYPHHVILFFLGFFQSDSILPLYLDRFVVRDATQVEPSAVSTLSLVSTVPFIYFCRNRANYVEILRQFHIPSNRVSETSPRCETVIPNVKPRSSDARHTICSEEAFRIVVSENKHCHVGATGNRYEYSIAARVSHRTLVTGADPYVCTYIQTPKSSFLFLFLSSFFFSFVWAKII